MLLPLEQVRVGLLHRDSRSPGMAVGPAFLLGAMWMIAGVNAAGDSVRPKKYSWARGLLVPTIFLPALVQTHASLDWLDGATP